MGQLSISMYMLNSTNWPGVMRPWSTSLTADPEDDDEGEAEHHLKGGPQHSHEAREGQGAVDVVGVLPLEERDFSLFLGVGADEARAGEVLLGAGADVAELGLNALETLVNAGAEILHENAGDGQGQKGPEGEPGTDADHEEERGDGEYDGVGRIHDGRAEQHAHGVEVVGGAGHDVAGAGALVEAEIEGFEMAEEIVAQVELNLARDADDDPAGEKLKDSFAGGDGDQKPAPGEQLGVIDAVAAGRPRCCCIRRGAWTMIPLVQSTERLPARKPFQYFFMYGSKGRSLENCKGSHLLIAI